MRQYKITRTHWNGEAWITVDMPVTHTQDESEVYAMCYRMRRASINRGERSTEVLYMVLGQDVDGNWGN